MIRTSAIDLEEFLKKFDSEDGRISQLEFRNVLRRLGLALTSREIDLIVTHIDKKGDGRIDLESFKGQIKPMYYFNLIF